MTKVLITGMSGTGTSCVLEERSRRGWDVFDTDYGAWKVPGIDGDLIWDTESMDRLLAAASGDRNLAVDGCVSNQGRFYDRFDAVVLLAAPIEVMLERVARRTNNDYGKNAVERAEIRANAEFVEPLLREGTDVVIDTSHMAVADVADRLILICNQP
jgi:RNase adaptor protein for sRNA GlmZ degradation